MGRGQGEGHGEGQGGKGWGSVRGVKGKMQRMDGQSFVLNLSYELSFRRKYEGMK